MADTEFLPTGAYIIRLQSTSSVVRMRDENPTAVSLLDLHKHRERQIWWVEPLPSDEHDPDAEEKGRIYTITNIAKNKGLTLRNGSSADGARVDAVQACGLPWQKWRIRKIQNPDTGDNYAVTNFHTGTALDFRDGMDKAKGFDIDCACWPHTSSKEQSWLFAVPLAAVPPGWIQIQNAATGTFLQHNYLTSPPFLADHPAPSKPSYYRETWGAQWAFIHPPNHSENDPHNQWIIKNRLTGGLLDCRTAERTDNTKMPNVHASESTPTKEEFHQWYLEANLSGEWKITSMNVSHPLMKSANLSEDGKVHQCKLENDVKCFSVTCSPMGFLSRCDKEASWRILGPNHAQTLPVAVPPPAFESQ